MYSHKPQNCLKTMLNTGMAYHDLVVLHTSALKIKWLMYQSKRNMLKKTGEILYKGLSEHTSTSKEFFFANLGTRRNYATWNACMRITELIKGVPPPRDMDPESGLEIMHNCDYSGKNHYLLLDKDFESTKFFKIFGSFTSKATPYKGKHPIHISDINLEMNNKPQYLHHYSIPMLIRKSDVKIDDLATISLSYAEYKKYLDLIK